QYRWQGWDGRTERLPGSTPHINSYAENPWYRETSTSHSRDNRHDRYDRYDRDSRYGRSIRDSRHDRYGESHVAPNTTETPHPTHNEPPTPQHHSPNTSAHHPTNSAHEWADRRDTAPVAHHRTERFDPTTQSHFDGDQLHLAGNRTRIDHDIRRFQD